MALFAELLPLLMVPVFAVVIWAIFEIFTFFLRPGVSTEEFFEFPGMAAGQVMRRKRQLSLYEIYSPHDGNTTTNVQNGMDWNAKSVEANLRVLSVPPNISAIKEEDYPPKYEDVCGGEVILAIEHLSHTDKKTSSVVVYKVETLCKFLIFILLVHDSSKPK